MTTPIVLSFTLRQITSQLASNKSGGYSCAQFTVKASRGPGKTAAFRNKFGKSNEPLTNSFWTRSRSIAFDFTEDVERLNRTFAWLEIAVHYQCQYR
jgi:hypothetical protein